MSGNIEVGGSPSGEVMTLRPHSAFDRFLVVNWSGIYAFRRGSVPVSASEPGGGAVVVATTTDTGRLGTRNHRGVYTR
jgi:hypothetical protein